MRGGVAAGTPRTQVANGDGCAGYFLSDDPDW